MRAIINTTVAILVVALGGGAWLLLRASDDDDTRVADARVAVNQVSREIRLRAAMGQVEVNGRGWPVTIDPDWFDHLPENALLSRHRPWMEIAPPEHAEFLHPPVRIAVDERLAAFWYNPGQGVIRARVPVTVSDRRTTEIYNRVNGASLTSIFERSEPLRRELGLTPTAKPAEALAGAAETTVAPLEEKAAFEESPFEPDSQ